MARFTFRRGLAATLIVAQVAACTHMPSGEKAFKSFDECVAANLGLAAVGGIAIGALAAAITRQGTDHRRTSNTVGVAAGIAATVMIGMVAWRKCAAVYSTSEVVAPPPAQPAQPAATPAAPPQRRKGLSVDRLDVQVEGNDETPPVPEFAFTYGDENPATKDIKAKFRHKVEIVRFKALDDDRLVLADANDKPVLDASGQPIGLDQAINMPRDRLHWVTIAEEGKEDYVEDVVIQQGRSATYRHKLQIPPRKQLPLPLPVPMRYRLTVQVGDLKATRNVDFALLRAQDRPKRFSAAGGQASNAATPVATRNVPAEASKPAEKDFAGTHVTKRAVAVYNRPNAPRKALGNLPVKAPVRVEEEKEIKVGGKAVKWVKVSSKAGPTGWLAASELLEAK
ncbi:hypothetical protein MYXO_01088 [Myxococcaceae bacterium]|nr:hypothetical protein MYXO_01088 [Myxococcaceae bacterium]